MESSPCYGDCGRDPVEAQTAFKCEKCQQHFHNDCLKSGKPSPLVGDIFFDFTCAECSETGQEVFVRMKLPWLPILMLALYNLQFSSTGCQGYFRWREHICDFIDKHWTVLFVRGRKKTQTWCGTVAGTLSIGCPTYFLSGIDELKQSGWWKLTENAPPTLDILNASFRFQKKERRMLQNSEENASGLKPVALRQRLKKSPIQAAMELKANRNVVKKPKLISTFPIEIDACDDDQLGDNDDGTDNIDPVDDECDSFTTEMSQVSSNGHLTYDCMDQSSQMSKSSCRSDGWFAEKDLLVCANLPEILMNNEDEDELDPCTITPERSISPVITTSAIDASNRLPPLEDILACLESPTKDDQINSLLCTEVKPQTSFDHRASDIATDDWSQRSSRELSTNEDEDCDFNETVIGDGLNRDDCLAEIAGACYRKKRQHETDDETQPTYTRPKLVLMSLYEEKELVKKWKMIGDGISVDPSLRRLRRKLLVREQQREHGVKVFDLDLIARRLHRSSQFHQNSRLLENDAENGPVRLRDFHSTIDFCNQPMDNSADDFRILDRFQSPHLPFQKPQYTSFINRLVGTDNNTLTYVYSPYSARSLKPYIHRDYQSEPLKLQLLKEITAYHNRKDPSWKPTPASPIDFCYVRPQHIPSVNALCKEFFWPGIDLSECLQYPDFSCVALYRKFVVGFAFLVPDVKFNEAYLSFIFTHPEWRRAGIASFMLYHVIQTSMGEEITLHVSASNPALLLYQKFGFKEEEFILDFYDKYFPSESSECRHALFMRLRR